MQIKDPETAPEQADDRQRRPPMQNPGRQGKAQVGTRFGTASLCGILLWRTIQCDALFIVIALLCNQREFRGGH